MKIVQILPELNSGGVERSVLKMADYLVRAGKESIIVSHGGRMVAELEQAGSRHIQMPVHRKSPGTLFQTGALRKLLAAERPDVLHIHSRVPGWVAWLAWRGMEPATRPRLVSTVHGFYSVNAYSSIMTKGERVIAVSECIRAYILKNFPETIPAIIRTIPQGVEPLDYYAAFQPLPEWGSRWNAEHPEFAGKKLLLLPGRITRLKGHEDIFRLVAALKNSGIPVCGLVAGEAHPRKQAYLHQLHGKIRELGVSGDIVFLGHRNDIREIMAVCDVVLSLSQQPESFGLTVLEALALGKPVVGYDYGGVGELLAALFPAGKVPFRDEAALTRVTHDVLQDHGRARPLPIDEPYIQESVCRATLAVYQELVASPR